MSPELIDFVKTFIWLPFLGIVAWAWNRNEGEHKEMKTAIAALKTDAYNGYATLNDKIMKHVDVKFEEAKEDSGKRIDRVNDHITKIFENAERDRAMVSSSIASLREDSFRRHIELMSAINSKADKE